MEATGRQIDFVDQLVAETGYNRASLGKLTTGEEYRRAIDLLVGLRDGGGPIRQNQVQQVHCRLKEVGIDREVLKAAIGIDSFTTATAAQGRACVEWLSAEAIERRRLVPPPALPEAPLPECNPLDEPAAKPSVPARPRRLVPPPIPATTPSVPPMRRLKSVEESVRKMFPGARLVVVRELEDA